MAIKLRTLCSQETSRASTGTRKSIPTEEDPDFNEDDEDDDNASVEDPEDIIQGMHFV